MKFGYYLKQIGISVIIWCFLMVTSVGYYYLKHNNVSSLTLIIAAIVTLAISITITISAASSKISSQHSNQIPKIKINNFTRITIGLAYILIGFTILSSVFLMDSSLTLTTIGLIASGLLFLLSRWYGSVIRNTGASDIANELESNRIQSLQRGMMGGIILGVLFVLFILIYMWISFARAP